MIFSLQSLKNQFDAAAFGLAVSHLFILLVTNSISPLISDPVCFFEAFALRNQWPRRAAELHHLCLLSV